MLMIFLTLFISVTASSKISTCACEIYCQGKMLEVVQMAGIFNDSKTFVDMGMKNSHQTTLKNFEEFMAKFGPKPTKEQIKTFVDNNFQDGQELDIWTPPDFELHPPILQTIPDKKYRYFIKNLILIWYQLGRITKPSFRESPERSSLISVPNGFIIPGGRFTEFYYWDSYWIIKGLLASNMHKTVRGMLDNFLSIVNRYGFVPNGGRLYYLNRSQPPLLTLMAYEYIMATGDVSWLTKNFHLLEKELKWWLKLRSVTFDFQGIKHTLAHYSVNSPSPRPESYKEDIHTCADKENVKNCYNELKSGAESGWDYSSRWFFDKNGGYSSNLSSIQVRRVIPVDLNSILTKSFGLLSYFSSMIGNEQSKKYWFNKYSNGKLSINSVFFNKTLGMYYDFDLKLKKHRTGFYPSNFAPLWCGLSDDIPNIGKLAVDYLKHEGVLEFHGGIPTSLHKTGQQWDFPNSWSVLQSMIILGLKRSKHHEAMKIAKKLAEIWINNNLQIFKKTGNMFEKYDAENIGVPGGGGEYAVQTGFGWSNGVIFELIQEFFSKNGQAFGI